MQDNSWRGYSAAICQFTDGVNTCPVCGLYTPNTSMPRNCRGERVPQPTAHDPVAPPPTSGPGTELKKLLAGWPFYITSTPDCSCNRVAAEMDQWGADMCEEPEKQDYILVAMRENAEKRGLPFLDIAGRMLLRKAIRNARKASA